jgi:hypothetical protein
MVDNGVIQPLEPLPPEWRNGRGVVVVNLPEQPRTGTEDIDT